MKLGTVSTFKALYAPVIEPGFIIETPLWFINFISWVCPLIKTRTPNYLALFESAS